ncbi:MAG TPA: 16S rRNA (guanine(527)-N(7))-methyltransferase RsmG [Rhabdaerophilum sp.]|nr:16S rRNA (guanine(527)-N(7))-methyltransferase RsmG [Rhabdaerophilum sp.]
MSHDGGIADAATRSRLAGFGVSRETHGDIDRYVALLLQWQSRINLVSPNTLSEIWDRHIVDSAQVFALRPEAGIWLDLGSGGGLPGIVTAILVKYRGVGRVHLVESNQKKAAFLRYVTQDLALPVEVHACRIEDCIERIQQPDIVTARALASLDTLVGYTNLLLKRGAVGLFPKGRDHQEELTEALRNWQFSYTLHPSATDPKARIIEASFPKA